MTPRSHRTALLVLFIGFAPAARAQPATATALAEQSLASADSPTINKTMIVGTDVLGTPAVANSAGTIGNSPIQVVGGTANDIGYLAFKYGSNGKGITNYWVKTRGAAMNSYGAVQNGDRIVVDLWQAGTGSQTGHAGGIQVAVDGAGFTAGEVGGRWSLFTGTGIASSQVTRQYPKRFGSINAIVANSYQQVLFPGGISAAVPAPGSNFGGWVVIGAGAASPGFGALKFLSDGAALLATPEPGALEVDATAKPYFTTGDHVRRAVMLADAQAPSAKALPAAGTGASVSIDASGNAGLVTLTTGSGSAAGELLSVTYAHPYATASYPVISAANAAAVPFVQAVYVSPTAQGFTLNATTAMAAGKAYSITFFASGK